MASNNPLGLGGGGTNPGLQGARLLQLEFPQSLAVYDDYEQAQRTVDHLSDEHGLRLLTPAFGTLDP